jgi:hypothetical protein
MSRLMPDDFPARVREVYIRCRRSFEQQRTGLESRYLPGPWWDGGKVQGKLKPRTNQWPNIASKLFNSGVNPDEYIPWLFDTWGVKFIADRSKNAPMPNLLGNQDRIGQFLKYRNNPETKIRDQFILEAQKREAIKAMLGYEDMGYDKQDAISAVIADGSLQLSALYRYCLAHRYDRPKLKKMFAARAKRQFSRNPDIYRTVWKDCLPLELLNRQESHQF